jgi:exosortase
LGVLYAPVFYILYKERWEMIDYGHAPFILPIALFIVWLKRKTLISLDNTSQTHFSLPGLLLTLTGAFLFAFGWRWEYLLIQVLSIFPLLLGMLLFFYGSQMIRQLIFPILYLFLLVPPPLGILDNITLPMRHLASASAGFILKTFHYPVSRSGLLLYLGDHEIFLGAPCSGFRSLITMFSLGLIYVYFNKGKFSKNLILVLCIVPLALFGNMLRVVTICLLTFYFGEKVGQGFLHEFSGMVVFVIMLAGLMGLERLLREPKK